MKILKAHEERNYGFLMSGSRIIEQDHPRQIKMIPYQRKYRRKMKATLQRVKWILDFKHIP